jgi:hypothetical protein
MPVLFTYWWNIGRNSASTNTPTGHFFDRGFPLRDEWIFLSLASSSRFFLDRAMVFRGELRICPVSTQNGQILI